MGAVLSYTDGYIITQLFFDSYLKAYHRMRTDYNRYLDKKLDLEEESYLAERTAKVVHTGTNVFLWRIIDVPDNSEHRSTGLTDVNGIPIYEGDKVTLLGKISGTVEMCCGAFGIRTQETIDYDYLCNEIVKWCGTENTEHFSWCDNFISFWELMWNFNHGGTCCCSVIKK